MAAGCGAYPGAVLSRRAGILAAVVAAGAEIGEIHQLGTTWSLFFRDLDGMELEVCAPGEAPPGP